MSTLTSQTSYTSRPVEIDYSHPPFFVHSKTTPNLFYTVVTTSEGVLRCECPARMNRKSRGCWHISAVLAGIVKPGQWKRPTSTAPIVNPARLGIADQSRPLDPDDLY